MNTAAATSPVPAERRAQRRLLIGIGVSVLLHALVLSLRFGVPGMGSAPGSTPISVRIAANDTPPAEPLPPLPPPMPAEPAPTPEPARAPVTGMRLVPPRPVPPPPAPVAEPEPAAKPVKPRKARRVSSPTPRTRIDEPPRVIAQNLEPNDFLMDVPLPEESEQKTIDPLEAQHGGEAGEDIAEAEAQAEREEEQRRLEQAQRLESERLADEARREQQRAAELAAQQKAEQERLARDAAARKQEEERLLAERAEQERQRSEQEQRERQRLAQERTAQELAARERLAQERQAEERQAQERAVQERLAQERAEQERLAREREERERAAQERLAQERLAQERLARERLAQERLAQERLARERLAQERAEQERLAQERALQERQARERAEQERMAQERLAQQRAEQEKLAQQRADQERLAQQRAAPADDPFALGPGGGGRGTAPGAGAGGAGQRTPKDMLGTDLGNRARELVKGLDLLKGAPPPASPGNRRVVVGAAERDVPLRHYVDSWRMKIERTGAIHYPKSWTSSGRADPLVNVAVRSDGTVEDVTIIRSSGRPDMDDKVLQIVRLNARYAQFPPNIASRYDVIDIRRIWRFDDVLKLVEELP